MLDNLKSNRIPNDEATLIHLYKKIRETISCDSKVVNKNPYKNAL